MQKFVLIEDQGGKEIYIDLISSQAGHYLSRRPHIASLLRELLNQKKLSGARVVLEQDMGRGIGTTDIVTTSDKDSIYYAKPVKSEIYIRFVKNRGPQPSNTLTVIAELDDDGNYEISNAWIGPKCPAFPGEEQESADSKAYWQSHALAHDTHVVQSRSITKDCPYDW
ncbi:MAG: hypothetical protein KIH63_000015 [Candidatus Saccharibacteria bacterium]|nr:hypothetical protein [Candidatus Saccharibacteria bacterium]